MPDNLKPCPFCGGEAEIHNCANLENESLALFFSGKSGVHCKHCGVATQPFPNKEAAIEGWNRRCDNG